MGDLAMTHKTWLIPVVGTFLGLLLTSVWIAAQSVPQSAAPYDTLRDFLNRDCPIGTTESDAQHRIEMLLKTGDTWEPLIISVLTAQTNHHAVDTLFRDTEHQQALEAWWAQYQSLLESRSVPSDQDDPLKAIAKTDKTTFMREWHDSWRRKHQERAIILLAARAARGSASADAALNAENLTDDKDLQTIIKGARRYFGAQYQQNKTR
jgi:hypothetical protein